MIGIERCSGERGDAERGDRQKHRINGGKIPAEAIEKHNSAVRGYNHADELGAKMRAASGLTDGSKKDAVTLNSFDDWTEAHAAVVKGS